jgi:hypothetical protein
MDDDELIDSFQNNDNELTDLFQDNANEYAKTNNIDGLVAIYNEYGVIPDADAITSAIINGNTDILDFLDFRNVKLTDYQVGLYYTNLIPQESKEWIDDNYLDFKIDVNNDDYSENLGESGILHIDKMRAKGFSEYNNDYRHEAHNDDNYREYINGDLFNDEHFQRYHHVKDTN